MTISYKNKHFSIIGPRSRSQLQFLEKLCHLLLTDFDITSHKYILNRFAVLNFRSKVKVTAAIIGNKLFHGSRAFLWTDFDVISYKFNNIWNKCVFQQCRSKVNVTDAILGKTCHGSSAVFVN